LIAAAGRAGPHIEKTTLIFYKSSFGFHPKAERLGSLARAGCCLSRLDPLTGAPDDCFRGLLACRAGSKTVDALAGAPVRVPFGEFSRRGRVIQTAVA
jgi:hypothetical protein